MQHLKSNWYNYLGISLIVGLLVNFYYLAYNPYGILFWGHLYLVLTIAFTLLLNASFKSIKNKKVFKGILYSLLLSTLVAFSGIVIKDYRILFFPKATDQLTKDQWRSDILYLKKMMEERHPGLNTLVSSQTFNSKFNTVLDNLNTWEEDRIKVELMHLVSMLNDGHSIVPPQPSINMHCLPFVSHKFDDGVYIIDAARTHQHLQNARLLKIGNTTVNALFDKLSPFIGAENEGNKWDRFPLYSGLTELLYQIEVSNSKTSVDLTYVKDGKTIVESVEGTPFYQWYLFYLSPDRKNNSLPYEHRILNNSYWFEYDDEANSLYVNINNLKDQSTESIRAFAGRLGRFIEKNEIDKTVIDLRNNRGGDNFKSRVIADVIKGSKINEYGRLFTLISRRTYSAAVNLATLLENQTQTIFVGESSGQGPTQFGDAKGVELPNSGIKVFLSSFKWQGSLPQDNRQAIGPDYVVEYDFEDFRKGTDPALKLIEGIKIEKKHLSNDSSLLGRYIVNNDQIAEVTLDSIGVLLNVTDFVPGSLRDIQTRLYKANDSTYRTDIKSIDLIENKLGLALVSGENIIPLVPIAEDKKLPIQTIVEGDVENGVKAIKDHLSKYKDYPLEGYLNKLGYQLLGERKLEEAKKVFEVNTELYPYSWNVWDSYGEVLMELGEIPNAKMAYSRSVELNPDNRYGKEMLIRIN